MTVGLVYKKTQYEVKQTKRGAHYIEYPSGHSVKYVSTLSQKVQDQWRRDSRLLENKSSLLGKRSPRVIRAPASPCSSSRFSENEKSGDPPFQLSSTDFSSTTNIPAKHTCQGKNVMPRLRWSGTPAATKSFVLVVDDPDAVSVVGKTFTHAVFYDIPGSASSTTSIGAIAKTSVNDNHTPGWYGPCPPRGQTHHYHFSVYALDVSALSPETTSNPITRKSFESKNKSHILGEARLVATYTSK